MFDKSGTKKCNRCGNCDPNLFIDKVLDQKCDALEPMIFQQCAICFKVTDRHVTKPNDR